MNNYPTLLLATLALAVLGFAIVAILGFGRRRGLGLLLGAGIVAWLYPTAFTGPLAGVSSLLAFLRDSDSFRHMLDAPTPPIVAEVITAGLLSARFDPTPMLIGAAMFASIAWAVDFLAANRFAEVVSGAASVVGTWSAELWRALATILSLLVGAYMVVLSVSAIPYFQQNADVPDELRPEAVRQRLQTSARSKDNFDKEFPESLGLTNPLAEIRTALASLATPSQQENSDLAYVATLVQALTGC